MSGNFFVANAAVTSSFDSLPRGCPGKHVCDRFGWTCLCNISRFLKRWQDVGESPFLARPHGPLLPLQASLSRYMPMIRHGSAREKVFHEAVVAVPTFKVLRLLKSGKYGPRFETLDELRAYFRVRQDAQILLVSVAKDKALERYWSYRNKWQVPAALARIGIMGITIPNYSSFIDAPSMHTKWNLRRMRRVAEEFSKAGVAIIPHLNARTRDDWDFWTSLLKEQPGIHFVCKEFQTGLHKYEVGLRALGQIAELQGRLKRKLHLVMVGGARFTHVAARHLDHFTVIDSVPFMKTVARQRCIELDNQNLSWGKHPLPREDKLDELLRFNCVTYANSIENRIMLTSRLKASERQMSFSFGDMLH